MRFTDEMEIVDVVRRFEDGSIGRDEWKHAEHLTVALYYLTNDGLGPATEKNANGNL